MRELYEEVMALQPFHSPRATPAMQRRGELVRKAIPERLRGHEDALRARFGGFKGRLAVRGSDGQGGTKAYAPWVRLYNPELSPSAQAGWYAVYLFRPDGAGVALCVSHGATRWDGAAFRAYPPEEMARLMRWGRALIGAEARALGFGEGVDLGAKHELGRAYETAAAVSKTYRRDETPADEALLRECGDAVAMLGRLYRAVEMGGV
jgi:hypothetical protein